MLSPVSNVSADCNCRKGVADEELAKREAERARKRQLEDDDDEAEESDGSPAPKSKRGQQESASSGSATPPPRRRADSPQSRSISPSPSAYGRGQPRDGSQSPRPERRQVYESDSDEFRRSIRSRTPDDRARVAPLPDLSPRRDPMSSRRIDSRSSSPDSSRAYDSRGEHKRVRGGARGRSRSRSRSPYAGSSRRYKERDGNGADRTGRPQTTKPAQPPRERSLSPFSKRLALTQAMNMGR